MKSLLFLLVLLPLVLSQATSSKLKNAPVGVKNDLFGMNFNWWVRGGQYANIKWPVPTSETRLPYDNEYLFKLMNASQSRITRWPGGTTGTFWNVTSNSFANNNTEICQTINRNATSGQFSSATCHAYAQYDQVNINNYPANYLAMENFGNAMADIGMPWIYVANLYTSTTEEISTALQKVCNPGNKACPTFLELGNEYYLSQFYPKKAMLSPANYINVTAPLYNQYSSNAFNNKIAGLSSFGGYAGTPSSTTTNADVIWNMGLFNQSGKAFDHLTIHIYSLASSDFRRSPKESWLTMLLAWAESTIKVTTNRFIGQFPEGVELWLTEFNYGAAEKGPDSTNDDANAFAVTQSFQPSHGLNIAGYYLSMLEYPKIWTKAWLFEMMQDRNLSCFATNTSGAYAHAPGQVFAHLSHIMKSHNTYSYLEFPEAPILSTVVNVTRWYNDYRSPMSSLQGAVFFGDETLTYVIMNRVGFPISVNLSESTPYDLVTVYEYIGNETITDFYYQIDVEAEQQFPWAGPIPVRTQPQKTYSGVFNATLTPYSLTVLKFQVNNTATTTTTTGDATTSTPTTDASTTSSPSSTTDSSTTSPSPTTSASTTGADDNSSSQLSLSFLFLLSVFLLVA